MLISYYELAVVAGAGRPGHPVTLDDHHKAVWALYTGTGKHEVPKGTPRPFVFSADEVPSRPGVFLFKIRSAQAFPKAAKREVEVNEGDSIKLAFRFQPVVSRNGRRVTTADTEWMELAEYRLRQAGVEAIDTTLTNEASRPKNRHHRNKVPPIVFCEVECVVADGMVLADHWTRGIAAGRAYGFGMLQTA